MHFPGELAGPVSMVGQHSSDEALQRSKDREFSREK